MPERARIWEVEIDRGGRATRDLYSATTRGKARMEAWRVAREFSDISFRDFLKHVRVRAYMGPVLDCYAYVRRAYGVDVKIGERISVRGECQGEVVYIDASSTAHVHVLFDGKDFALPVHPRDIVKLSPGSAAAHSDRGARGNPLLTPEMASDRSV